MSTGRAAVLKGERTLTVEEIEPPKKLRDGEALLEVLACGICGTDLGQYQGEMDVAYPLIPGHEIIGRVVDLTARATETMGVDIGERVAVGSPVNCGRCEFCRNGRGNLCQNGLSYGFTSMENAHGLWGGYADYLVLHPNTQIFPIPDGVDSSLAAMFNPIANGIKYVEWAEPRLGDSILILGPGQRGLASVIAAVERGVDQVIVTGLKSDQLKLSLAEEMGATETINVSAEDTVNQVMALTDGNGVDCVIDTTPGAIQPVIDGIDSVKRGGTVVLTGHKGFAPAEITVDEVILKEIDIRGAFTEGPWADEQAIRLIASGAYPFEKLHTHSFDLTEAESAVRLLEPGNDEPSIHVSIHPST